MNARRKKNIIIVLVAVGVTLLVVTATLATMYFMKRTPRYDTVIIPDAEAISIDRDRKGTPLITSSNLRDAYLALGYLHSLDRLFLMEYHRAIARGNISRILGDKALPLERLSTALEIDSRSEAILNQLSATHRGYLDAYCRGINMAREGGAHGAVIPIRWEATDIIAILLMREWSNAFLSNRELIFPLPEKHRMQPEGAFFPADLHSFFSPEEEKGLLDLLELKKLVHDYIGTFNRGFAASIDPRQSFSGKRLAFFSMEGSMTVYPSHYPVIIRMGGETIQALSVAGLPFLFSGLKENCNFFGFSLACDSQEFFVERPLDQDHTSYLSPRGPKRFRLIVRQSDAASMPYRIRMTDNGPVVHDILNPEGNDESFVTIRSIFPEADYVGALFDIPECDTIDKVSLLATRCQSLPRIYLLADQTRSIRVTGGRFTASAGYGRTFLKGELFPPSANVFARFHEIDYRANSLAGSSFLADLPLYFRRNGIPSQARQKRLESLLFTTQRMTEEKVMEILTDTHSLTAETFTPLFLAVLRNNPVTSARISRIYLADWDFRMDTDLVAPAIYRVQMENFMMETIGDEIGPWKEHVRNNLFLLTDNFETLVSQNRSALFDNTSTDRIETMENDFDLAFMKTMRILGRKKGPIMDDWKWGVLHMGRFHIPIRETSLFSRLIPSVKKIELGGSTDTVFEGTENSDLVPFHTTALCGYSTTGSARMLMNFGYSIAPMSAFYYGKMGARRFSDFTGAGREYRIDINPSAQ